MAAAVAPFRCEAERGNCNSTAVSRVVHTTEQHAQEFSQVANLGHRTWKKGQIWYNVGNVGNTGFRFVTWW